ncbi:hypothetical protein [Ruegeria sp. Alg231-54]|uniref:hypothetical protein n=1 Tax=Ruegeria sp. Alg231-54 TaxID=1922221 RepID=UPI00131EFCB5|nr:hypothetical protein [Ruegeria sp. Alg231-54]
MKLAVLKFLAPMFAIAGTASFAMSEADDACIDHLRQVGGPDGQSGTIESSAFSEAGTLVMLRDAGGRYHVGQNACSPTPTVDHGM